MSELLVLGVSGPDGAGKSTLAEALAGAARARGQVAEVIHLYGCLFCRRASPRQPDTAPHPRHGPGARASGVLRGAHALVDAAELAARLALARARLRRRARRAGAAALLVTDRSPLDALAKHDPPPASAVGAVWLRLAGAYTRILALDAPAAVLAERDGEHSADEMERWRQRFAAWTPRVPAARVQPAQGAATDVLAAALGTLG